MSAINTASRPPLNARSVLNKVPEVTVWFWVIKILCTTVGESFADWINTQLGVGLVNTAWIFTAVFIATLTWQLRTARYVPFVYWLNVVVVSVTGTLYTDILTDQVGMPLWLSSSIFTGLLVATFGVWFVRERTLSIHSINSLPRELFYWLTVLVTFALGTATGDWTLELTGWSPGVAVLLPLGLIAIITALWKFGMNSVLSFWLAYILTRPLGANIGDFLGMSKQDQGLGLGTFVTSLIFLAAILATVVYLTISKVDVAANKQLRDTEHASKLPASRTRQIIAGVALAAVAVCTAGVLTVAHQQPHAAVAAEAAAPSCSNGSPVDPAQAKQHVTHTYSLKAVDTYRKIVSDALAAVNSGDAARAATSANLLESTWDHDKDTLQPLDCQTWTYVDQQIDQVLTSIRAAKPDAAVESKALSELSATLG